MDTSGFTSVVENLPRWKPDSTLEELSRIWSDVGHRNIAEIDGALSNPAVSANDRFMLQMTKAMFLNYEGEPRQAYELLEEMRPWVESEDAIAEKALYTLIYFQGVTALRRGETDNCVMCRGESSCILPIAPRPCTPTRPVPGWRSGTSPNIWRIFPTIMMSAGC